MAVYQSGTRPIIRARYFKYAVPPSGFHVLPHVMRRMIMREYKIPRKASWALEEDPFNGMEIHRFDWFEVETNVDFRINMD